MPINNIVGEASGKDSDRHPSERQLPCRAGNTRTRALWCCAPATYHKMAQVEVRFYTQQYRPDHKVTIRGEQVDNWQSHLAGTYQLGYWRFFLSSANLLTFKFVLDHERWQGGDNIQATPPPPGGALSFGDGFEGVWFQDEELPVPESGAVARSFFAPDLNEEREYDIIVVGSGVGGGTLAEELSDRGLTTLVLEAGSYLFPTHIANISRAHKTGEFDKHVW